MRDSQVIMIIILAALAGYFASKLKDRRKQDIIKIMMRQDLLKPAAPGTAWMEGGACYMNDGQVGKVRGQYCQQITPL